MADRTCAYCGLGSYGIPIGQPRCKCKYREGRMGEFSISVESHSREGNVAEMKKIVADLVGAEERRGAWRISFTDYHQPAIAKADAKRAKEQQ